MEQYDNQVTTLIEQQSKLMKTILLMTLFKFLLIVGCLFFISSTFNVLKYNQRLMKQMQPAELIRHLEEYTCR